jgi:Zn-dependent protease
MGAIPIQQALCIAAVLFLAVGLHEYAHCKVADLAGDPTPGIYGRVTLNLTKHFEPVGTIMMILTSISGFGIGWGRPAPCNPSKMRNPRWDHFATVIAGPLCNLAQAVVWGMLFRVLVAAGVGFGSADGGIPIPYYLALQGVLVNLSLCFFNLFPLGPLDGHWLVGLLMPEKPRYYWFRFNQRAGTYLLLILILGSQTVFRGSGGIMSIFYKPISSIFSTLTGMPPLF